MTNDDPDQLTIGGKRPEELVESGQVQWDEIASDDDEEGEEDE